MQHLGKIPPDGQHAISRRLAAVRERSGLNQADFAAALGFAKRSYLSWERMESEPPMALVEALTRTFDVDATWLMVGPDDEPRYVHNSSSARLARVHRAIEDYAAEAGVLLPVERTEGLALSVVREPIAYEAPILRTIREAIFLEAGKAP